MKSDSWLHRFLHNQPLKHKLYVIIFESDTPAGKAFDVTLIICILLSILLAIIESLQGLPSWLSTPFIVLEYLFTVFFTFEYVTRIYCSPNPRKYIFSFFGIVDLLATLPLYLAFFLILSHHGPFVVFGSYSEYSSCSTSGSKVNVYSLPCGKAAKRSPSFSSSLSSSSLPSAL